MTEPDERAALDEDRQRLLAARLGRGTNPVRKPEVAAIPPLGAEEERALTAGQRSLLFESRRRPGSPVYNVCHSHVLPAGIDANRLAECFRRVAERHDPLRVAFDQDRTRLTPQDAVSVRVVSASTEEWAAVAAAEATTPIDLDHGPLLRLTFGELPDSTLGLITTVHHVSSDAGSMAAMWAEVDALYQQPGPPRSEPPPNVTYAGHARWQETRVTPEELRVAGEPLATWDGRPLGLNTSPPPPGGELGGGYLTVPLTVDPQLAGRPLPVFLGAWGALLQWYGDAPEPVVGMTVSRRDHPAAEHLIGYFLSALPIRLPAPDQSFRQLVHATDVALAEVLRHRHVPVTTINAALRSGGTEVAPPMAMFVFDEPPELKLAGEAVATAVHHNGTAVGALTLFVRPSNSGWEASLEFDRAHFRDDAAAQLLDDYHTLLQALLDNPDKVVTSVIPTSAGADDEGPAIVSALTPLPELILDHATRQPDAVAVSTGEQEMTWSELSALAGQVTDHVRSRGIGAGQRVVVALPRSTEIVATIVGVLAAGAAYVPVDPEYPHEQQARILNAADPAMVIDPVLVDEIRATPSIDQLPTAPPDRLSLDDPAYVVFTSGSTGEPRGVMVTHRQLAASTMGRRQVYDDVPPRFMMVSSFGFDSSIAGLFWTLATGGRLILPTDAEVHDIDALGQLAHRRAATHTLMVPSLWDALLRRSPEQLSAMREVIVAGEACSAAVADRHVREVPHASLTNEYGPTEATVWAASHRVSAADTARPIPIGRAIPGVTLRVADRWGRPRPVGVAGELWIAGAGLTNGYINDADATADRFVTLDHEDAQQHARQRWYRSGDRVRQRADQSLDFLGRIDGQLSVGGVRVEPEQIELVITQLESVGAAGVALVDRGPRGSQLVAFAEASAVEDRVVKNGNLVRQITDACRSHLPPALVPKRIHVLPSLPRTPHGKIDRAALPALDTVSGTASPSTTARRHHGDHETNAGLVRMRALWADVLGVLEVGDTSDFFDIGGDSLGAFELCLAVEQHFGVEVPTSALIGSRTPISFLAEVEALSAEQLAVHDDDAGTEPGPPVRSLRESVRPGDPARAPLILLAPGGGHLLGYKPLVDALDPDQPVVGFRLPGADGREPPVRSIEAQADRIYPEIAAMVDRPIRMLGLSTGGLLGLELAHRLTADGHPPELLALGDTIYPGFQDYGRVGLAERLRKEAAGGRPHNALRYVANRVKLRAETLASRARTQRYERTGQGFSPAAHELYLYGIAGELARTYVVRPYAGSTVLFSASVTDSARTEVPWTAMISRLQIIGVDGEHDAIIEDPAFVDPLANALQQLLDNPESLDN